MKQINVLISAPYLQREFEDYRSMFQEREIHCHLPQVVERLEEEELLEIISGYDGVICGDDAFTPRVLDAAARLKVIVKWGTGIDSIDKEYAENKSISVLNCPGAFTQPVSDTVMAYLLAFSRGIFYSQRKMAAGKWEKVMGKTPGEQTLGIIGIGNIGSEVARKAKAFGMKLLGNDIRTIPAGVCESLGILMVTLDNLLENADVVSINCDLNPSSYHLLGQKEFKRMKNTAILINTARGPIVNETELIRALQQERIAGAALDVFEKEPLAVNSPLRKMDNVLLAAHNSNSSPKYWRLVHEKTIAYLLENLA